MSKALYNVITSDILIEQHRKEDTSCVLKIDAGWTIFKNVNFDKNTKSLSNTKTTRNTYEEQLLL